MALGSLGNYWIIAVLLPVFIILKQCEKLMFSGFRYQPEELFPVPNARRRFLVSLLDNIYRLFETYIILRIIALLLLSFSLINLSIDFSRVLSLNHSVILFAELCLFSVLISLFGYEIRKEGLIKQYLHFILLPVYWVYLFLTPIVDLINEIILVIDRKIFDNKFEQDYKKIGEYFWGETVEEETPDKDESELIDGIVSFKEISAKEVMTPRTDIVAVSDEENFDELLRMINSSRHSRIPLYKNDLDNIIGIIYAKDLLPLIGGTENGKDYIPEKVARKVLYIPETKMIKDLLNEFQEKKMHIAIVIDEFGGTAGLITLEDIIEEIVGEIRDELDIEENLVTKIENNRYLVLGKTSIEELNDLLDISLPVTEGYDSIAGFILSNAGEFPKEGFSFNYGQLVITVKELINKRIKKVLIEKF